MARENFYNFMILVFCRPPYTGLRNVLLSAQVLAGGTFSQWKMKGQWNPLNANYLISFSPRLRVGGRPHMGLPGRKMRPPPFRDGSSARILYLIFYLFIYESDCSLASRLQILCSNSFFRGSYERTISANPITEQHWIFSGCRSESN